MGTWKPEKLSQEDGRAGCVHHGPTALHCSASSAVTRLLPALATEPHQLSQWQRDAHTAYVTSCLGTFGMAVTCQCKGSVIFPFCAQ